MKSFETVYNQLTDLFINKLPDYINKTNEVLVPVENRHSVTG